MANHITVAQLGVVVEAIETKTDARFRKLADKIAESDLASALATKVNGKADAATTLAGYGIADAYTKTEIDGKIAAGVHYKGTVADYASLPATGQVIGDMYNVTAADPTHGVNAGDNVVWGEDGWDVLTGVIDLSSKQDVLTPGTNIQIDANGNISATDTTYTAATQSEDGLMSATDKAKLDGFAEATSAEIQAIVDGLYGA